MRHTHWNYRVVRNGDYLGICEVYYTDGKPDGHCEATPGGDTLEEIKQDLGYMHEALELPILDVTEIKGWKP
jgi:hypothetical protein